MINCFLYYLFWLYIVPGYIGCYQHTYYGGAYEDIDQMTIQKCKEFCISMNYSLAGANGQSCHCYLELDFDIRPDATCDYGCPGNDNEKCGNNRGVSGRISLYNSKFSFILSH